MHEPVMVAEVLEHLAPARGGVFVDCTVGYGGHTRAMLAAGASRVIGLDRDQDALRHAAAALASEASRVELVQGGSFLDARYTVMLERADADTIRFWMDPSAPHDIRDVWGFFRVKALPGGRSLITVGAALDLGDGLPRLFEDKVARMMLRAPRQIRDFVQPRALALSR